MRLLWRWGPMLAQMGAIFYASSLSAVPDLPGGMSDKTAHMIGYALLSAFTVHAFSGARWAAITGRAAIGAVLFSAFYGATDEFHQKFVPNRTSDIHDWYADAAGAVLGVAIVLLVARLFRRRGA